MGKRHVWLLYWYEAIEWDEMELVPGLYCLACVMGKGWGRRNGIGAENRGMQGKEPLLPCGQIRLMS